MCGSETINPPTKMMMAWNRQNLLWRHHKKMHQLHQQLLLDHNTGFQWSTIIILVCIFHCVFFSLSNILRWHETVKRRLSTFFTIESFNYMMKMPGNLSLQFYHMKNGFGFSITSVLILNKYYTKYCKLASPMKSKTECLHKWMCQICTQSQNCDR